LPTEAEWAWAARVQGGDQQWKFPWGDELPPKDRSGNYADISAAPIIGNIIQGFNDGHVVAAPVASFPANIRGIYDLGGNVAEWVHDYYHIPLSSENTVTIDPLGPETGEHHVIRGASWAHGTITELRLSFRDYGTEPRTDLGFRIARYVE
jgi:formylglycine-generating enzyme required for sulfatase activity